MNNLEQLASMKGQINQETQQNVQKENQSEEDLMNDLVETYSPKVKHQDKKPFKIGICGGHASGKGLLRDKLIEELISCGYKGYTISQDQFDVEKGECQTRCKRMAKLPLFHLQITRIIINLWQCIFLFLVHAHETLDFLQDVNVILIEGNLIFYDKGLRDKFDLKIFLQGDRDIRLSRTILREVSNKGRDVQEVIDDYLFRQKPLYEKYIKPTDQYADMIIPNFGGDFTPTNTSASSGGCDDLFIRKLIILLLKIVKTNAPLPIK